MGLFFFNLIAAAALPPASTPVKFSHGKMTVPTYTFGNSVTLAPVFQSTGIKGLYPYTSFDRESLSAVPVPMEYESLTLENEYLKVVLLPELGGRVWSAWDKSRGRHIFYHTEVIKPSAYNQRGAWPAGNLEVYGPYDAHMLTWPGEPWSWATETHEDGSASITLSHIEHFFRNKVSMKVTLRPGHSFLELSIRLHNRNSVPNRYLLWTNAGLPATEGTRFMYPMTKTIGHDSAEFGAWPVFNGVDLSWYKNNKVMLGVFGLDVYDNFMGAYDYDEDYGTFCYTDRRIARGIKTWTWGVGGIGLRHVENYTDSGIPYIEVQSGRFVWDGNYEFIGPGKSDGWTEYWYGIGGLGGMKTASRDVVLNLDFDANNPGLAKLRVSSTGNYPEALLSWSVDGVERGKARMPLAVGETAEREVDVSDLSQSPIQFRLASEGTMLLEHTVFPDGQTPMPEVSSGFIPREFGLSEELTAEELFQKGLTNEKLGRLPEAQTAYGEALIRDPNMIGPNIQLGLLAWSRLEPEETIEHFERALEREPFNGDALFYLAVVHSDLGNFEESRRLYYRLLPSSGNFEQRDYGLGLLAMKEQDYLQALRLLQSAARHLPTQLSVRHAKALALRRLGHTERAAAECDEILALDPTNAFARAERVFLTSWTGKEVAELERIVTHPQGYLELATEYMSLGAWKEVEGILSHALTETDDSAAFHPLLFYYRAFALSKMGESDEARTVVERASEENLQVEIFPFRRQTVEVLRTALSLKPGDANAAFLLGALLYSRSHRTDAKDLWERAIEHDPQHFSSLQHLGWALVEEGQVEQALAFLDRAAQAQPGDLGTATGIARLYARRGLIDGALEVVNGALREHPGYDQLIELQIKLMALNGDYDEALQILDAHQFGARHQSYSLLHLYQAAHLLKAYQFAREKSLEQALEQIQVAGQPPSSLGVDDFAALASSRLLFFEALTHSLNSDSASSRDAWRRASETVDQDADGEGLFRAIGLFMVGEREETEKWFAEFEEVNELRKKDNDTSVKVLAYYLSGIYSIFRGRIEEGRLDLESALKTDESDLFSRHAILWLNSSFFQGLNHNPK